MKMTPVSMILLCLTTCLISPVFAQLSTRATTSLPSVTLVADARVSLADGALTAAVIGVNDCDSTFVIQCFGNVICSLHGPATVTQGPSHYASEWVYTTPGGLASHSESCSFSAVPGLAQCLGYTTITNAGPASSTSLLVVSSAFSVAVATYQFPITQGAMDLEVPWSVCTPTGTASVIPMTHQAGSGSGQSGLSVGAQAGIGVGVGVGGALLLGLLGCCLLRQRRVRQAGHRSGKAQEVAEMSGATDGAAEKASDSYVETQAVKQQYELPGETMTHQLYGSETASGRHELPVDKGL